MKRREFLTRTYNAVSIGLAGLVATLWSALAEEETGPSARRKGNRIMLNEVTADVFAEHLGSTFHIHHESGLPLVVSLIEATPLTTPANSGSTSTRCQPCSIIFRGPFDPVLPQKTYRIQHESLGRMDFFLVPIGPDAKGMRYEAVFN